MFHLALKGSTRFGSLGFMQRRGDAESHPREDHDTAETTVRRLLGPFRGFERQERLCF